MKSMARKSNASIKPLRSSEDAKQRKASGQGMRRRSHVEKDPQLIRLNRMTKWLFIAGGDNVMYCLFIPVAAVSGRVFSGIYSPIGWPVIWGVGVIIKYVGILARIQIGRFYKVKEGETVSLSPGKSIGHRLKSAVNSITSSGSSSSDNTATSGKN